MKNKILLVPVMSVICHFSMGQNIGIGTNNPTRARLEVNGAVSSTSAIFGGDGTGISLQRNWPAIGFNSYYNSGNYHLSDGYAAVQVFDPTNGIISFDMYNQGTPGMYSGASTKVLSIYHDGTIAMGDLVANATLSVAKYQNKPTAWLFGTSHHSVFNFGNDEKTYIRAGKDNGTVVINDIPNGKIAMMSAVGINTGPSLWPLEIRQPVSDRGLLLVNGNNSHNWELRVAGSEGELSLYRNGLQRGVFLADGNYYNVSDQRLKTNIEQLPALIDRIMKLQPVSYTMKHDSSTNRKQIGFIAQDVEKYFPELVNTNPGTNVGYGDFQDLRTVNYSAFAPLAIKAIQEQQKTISEQRDLINQLLYRVDKLESNLVK